MCVALARKSPHASLLAGMSATIDTHLAGCAATDGALGEPGPLQALVTSPVLSRIGAKYQRSPEEVALRWCIQNGVSVSVRPTAEFALGSSFCRDDGSCAKGLSKRAQVFSWALEDAEMEELNALRSPDGNPTLFSSSGCPGAFVMPKK